VSLLPVARLGDPSNHGGRIITASGTTFADGIAVARNADLHQCPLAGHGTTPLTATTTITSVDGRRVIRVGDRAGCGAVITAGSPTMFSS
jgi:uncharacterized Zn-binding protein involved in type VI secretion